MNATLIKRLFRAIHSGPDSDVNVLCRRIVEEEKKRGHARVAKEIQPYVEPDSNVLAKEVFRECGFELTEIYAAVKPSQYVVVIVNWRSSWELKRIVGCNYFGSGERMESVSTVLRFNEKCLNGEKCCVSLEIGLIPKEPRKTDKYRIIPYRFSHFHNLGYGVEVYFEPVEFIGKSRTIFEWRKEK